MTHVRIAVYKFIAGVTAEQVARQTRELSLPIYQQQPGFVAYESIQAEDDVWISVTTWQSREQADAASEQIGAWIKKTPEVASLVRSREHQWIGDIVYSSREP